jgi:hypothetical protein
VVVVVTTVVEMDPAGEVVVDAGKGAEVVVGGGVVVCVVDDAGGAVVVSADSVPAHDAVVSAAVMASAMSGSGRRGVIRVDIVVEGYGDDPTMSVSVRARRGAAELMCCGGVGWSVVGGLNDGYEGVARLATRVKVGRVRVGCRG